MSGRGWGTNGVLVAAGIGIGALLVAQSAAIAFAVPATVGLLGLLVLVETLTRWDDDPEALRRLRAWTIGAFVAHLLFGLAIMASHQATSYLGGDATTYHDGAVALVRSWTRGLPGPTLATGRNGFYYLLAVFYWVFGAHPAAGIAVNAAMAAALVPLVSDSTERLFGKDAARFVAPLVVLLPSLFIWTSQLLKEAPVLFLVALVLCCAVRLRDRVTLTPFAVLAVSLPLLFAFRAVVGLALAGAVVAAIPLARRQAIGGLSVGLGVLSGIAVIVLALGLGYSGYRAASALDLQQATVTRRDLSRSANSGFGAEVDVSTRGRALTYLPVGLVQFSLGPFPWQVHGTSQLPALIDVLALWALVPSLWRGLREAGRRLGRGVLVVVLPAGAMAIPLALAAGNFGTVVRERMPVVIFVVPLIALGLALRRTADATPVVEPAPVAP